MTTSHPRIRRRATENLPKNPLNRLNSKQSAAGADTVPIPAAARFQYPPGTLQASLSVSRVQQALQICKALTPRPMRSNATRSLPGALDRILGMAERLQAAQIKQTETNAHSHRNDTRRAHWLGFVAAIAA